MTPDWDSVTAAIGAATRSPFAIASAKAVHGGSIHSAWRIGDGRREFFVKTGATDLHAVLDAEAQALRALAAAHCVRTPGVIACGTSTGTAYLVLEVLDLAPLDAAAGARLGESLATLHRVVGEDYGWERDNFIGTTPQYNASHPSWPYFFGDRRLRPQLELARSKGMESGLVAQGMAVIERLGGLFIDYRPAPSLLHGDLWSGNAGMLGDGEPVIFDPACYRGDRETDIAMAELFGGFPTSFFAAYRAAWPLDRDYERRKPLYNLYHVLNHFNLFGDAYLGQARRIVEGLLSQLRR